MRVTVLAPRDPIPVNNGLTERVYQLARHLGSSHDVSVLFPHEPERADGAEGREPDDRPFERIPLRSRVVDVLERALPEYSALRGVYHAHPWLYPQLRRHVRSEAPDAVVVEFPYLVPVARAALRGVDAPLVLSAHNVEYRLAKRLGVPLWPLLAACEGVACSWTDAVVAVSETDREALAERADGVRFVLAPNGVDVGRYSPAAGERAAAIRERHDLSSPVLVYHGNLANAQNSEAVDALLTTVFPAVRERFPSATLLLVGPNPPDVDRDGVVAAGLVDDLPGYLAAADVAAVPLASGSGTKLKVLEYLATGVPVVTTPVGAEGLPLTDGDTALVTDGTGEDARDVTDATVRLLEDPDLAERLRAAGRELVVSEFDWSQTLAPYDDLLAELGTGEPSAADQP